MSYIQILDLMVLTLDVKVIIIVLEWHDIYICICHAIYQSIYI